LLINCYDTPLDLHHCKLHHIDQNIFITNLQDEGLVIKKQ